MLRYVAARTEVGRRGLNIAAIYDRPDNVLQLDRLLPGVFQPHFAVESKSMTER